MYSVTKIKYILEHREKYSQIVPIDEKYGHVDRQVMFHLANFVNHPREFHDIFLALLAKRQSECYLRQYNRNLVGERRISGIMSLIYTYVLPYLAISLVFLHIRHPYLVHKIWRR